MDGEIERELLEEMVEEATVLIHEDFLRYVTH